MVLTALFTRAVLACQPRHAQLGWALKAQTAAAIASSLSSMGFKSWGLQLFWKMGSENQPY